MPDGAHAVFQRLAGAAPDPAAPADAAAVATLADLLARVEDGLRDMGATPLLAEAVLETMIRQAADGEQPAPGGGGR